MYTFEKWMAAILLYVVLGLVFMFAMALEHAENCPKDNLGTSKYVAAFVVWPLVVLTLAADDEDGVLDCQVKQ